MGYPLDLRAVRARIARASAHTATVSEMVDAYVALPPWRVTYHAGSSAEREVQRAELMTPVPLEIAIVLSDAIHQGRAALDNMVTALRGGVPSASTYFPITKDPVAYSNLEPSYLHGVPTWARTLIRDMQSGRYVVASDILADRLVGLGYLGERLECLHDLARQGRGKTSVATDVSIRRQEASEFADRHRAPLLQLGILEPDYVVVAEDAEVQFRADLLTWAETEYVAGRVGDVHFKAEVRFAGSVPGVGGHEVVPLLNWALWAVGDVAARLEREAARQA